MSNDPKNDSALAINAAVLNSSVNCVDWHCATREIDTAGWLFDDDKEKPPNLTVLPSLAVIIFLVLVFLKVYKWYKDNAKRKARGDVEFGDDSEVNYGIIKEGDKEFCTVEIRSDTTSVYDTVNSFRLFSNGHVPCVNAAPTYHDTVSSYKSLLIQRGDASHYDSVKSYKAFLKQVTQNKNLDVEVKLLENYPMKCKSTEHCVLVEEEFGAPPNAKSRLFPGNTKACADGKKFRYRRASGEPLGPMRKRSASNPIYNSSRTGATSLPSIHYSVSSDDSNEEDTLSAFRNERKKAYEDRCKKMSRSCSGGKLSKVSKTLEEEDEAVVNPKRKRHYSADGCSRLGKGFGNVHFKISRAFQHELNNLRESISETDPKLEEHVLLASQEESSSENPDSSPSSRDSSVSSDAIESESDDDTQQVTQISAISDCTAFNSNELASSIEQLSTHSACSDGFNSMDVFSLKDTMPSSQQACSSDKSNNVSTNEIELNEKNCTSKNSTQDDVSSHTYQKAPQTCSDQQIPHGESNHAANDVIGPPVNNVSPSVNRSSSNPTIPSWNAYHKPITAAAVAAAIIHEVDDSEDTDNSMASNPRRVKRFHVTSVQKDDVASLKLDSRQSSSGGSLFES